MIYLSMPLVVKNAFSNNTTGYPHLVIVRTKYFFALLFSQLTHLYVIYNMTIYLQTQAKSNSRCSESENVWNGTEAGNLLNIADRMHSFAIIRANIGGIVPRVHNFS